MPPESTSFIPKAGVKTVQRRSTRRIYVLAYISYIVFFSTLFAVIGVYIYGATVSRSLSSLKQQLVDERQRFSNTQIEEIRLLDRRLTLADRLLNESSAPSRLFPDLEAMVASNIYFSGMKYETLPNRQFRVELTGRAANFNEVIGQRNLFDASTLLQNAQVVEYDYSIGEGSVASGQATVTFVFADTRDLSAIPYVPATNLPAAADFSTTEPPAVIIEGSVTPAAAAATDAADSQTSTSTPASEAGT